MNIIQQISNISRNSFRIIQMILLLLFIFIPQILVSQVKSTSGISKVIIDAGHGGKDPGAVVGRAREKDIVLDIALKIGKLIKKELPDLKVIYTRDGDFFVPLFKRSEIANKNNADLFISIHANYCSTPSVKGTETYVLGLHRNQDNFDVAKKENSVIVLEEDYTTRYEGFDPNMPESYISFELIQNNHIEQSIIFAGMVQDLFRQQARRPDRDVRQAGFLVLRETAMPSVLIEAGYLSNKAEADYLMTQEGRETIAAAIFRSVKNYKKKYDSRLNLASAEAKALRSDSDKNTVLKKNNEAKQEPVKEIKVKSEEQPQPLTLKQPEKIKYENPRTNDSNDKYSFAIQIAASKTRLPQTLRMFNGIKDIKEIKIAGYYKYYCFESGSRQITSRNLSAVKKKIPDAFMVGMKNGLPIPEKEVPRE